jgi:Na+:H+ antiporter, NhaA family
LLIRFAGAQLPAQSSWPQFFGVCALCGVGFTMSLFIGSLAFEGMSPDYAIQVKLGVLGGSVVATLIGVSILLLCRAQSERAANSSAY